MVLAVDVGGTKTRVGVFSHRNVRPEPVEVASFRTLDFTSLDGIVEAFFDASDHAARSAVEAMCAGAAGPVVNGTVELTNVPWTVDVRPTAEKLGDCPAIVINDLEATAYGVTALGPDELYVLQSGTPVAGSTTAIIAAGTGLGEALIIDVDGRKVPRPTEAGHADFAARSSRERDLAAALVREFGRATVEHVVSGPGLRHLFYFTHVDRGCEVIDAGTDDDELPARVSESAMTKSCPRCVDALDMFVEAYGAEAGNLALRSLARGGIYVGGGIAPKILGALSQGAFMEAFRFKPPMEDLLRSIPVRVVLNEDTALLGAAVHARQIARAALT